MYIAGRKGNIGMSSHLSISSWIINLDMNSEVSCFALFCNHSGIALYITEDANPLFGYQKNWCLVLVN